MATRDETALTVNLDYPPLLPPTVESNESRVTKLVAWAKNCLHYRAVNRLRNWVLWRLADLFFDGDQTGQMIDRLGYAGQDLARMYQRDDPGWFNGNDMPDNPVLNEFKDHILNEASRLDKSDYEGIVRVTGEGQNYRKSRGAKIATRALRSMLQAMGWDQKKRVAAMHLPMYGGVWHVSRWVTSMEKTTRVPVDGCLACPQCGCKYAGPIPAPPPASDGAPMLTQHMPGNCPQCESHDIQRPPTPDEINGRALGMQSEVAEQGAPPLNMDHPTVQEQLNAPMTQTMPFGPPLQQFTPAGAELSETDPYGRPLGEDVPLGEWDVRLCWPGDMFEYDLGIGTNGDYEIRDVTIVRVRSLEALRAEYPNARTDKLKPEERGALWNYHPMAGEIADIDARAIWRSHAREIMRVKMPWMEEVYGPDGRPVKVELPDGSFSSQWKLNRGRVVVVANGVVLRDEELMFEGPDGTLIPKVLVTYTPHDVAAGGQLREGSSLAKQLMDAQRWVNFGAAQDIDEQRNGQSRWVASDRVNLSYDQPEGYAMSVYRYGAPPDASNPQDFKPELITRPTADIKWGASSERASKYMAKASRAGEVEAGEIPGPNTPAQALQIAREESGAVRKPRVKGLAGTYERIYTHGLQLAQHYVREPRVAWDETDSRDEFQTFWQGADFEGQTDVKVEVSSAGDSEILRQAKLSEALKNGIVDINDARQRRIIGREMGVPEEINEQDNEQEAVAEREYLEFTDGLDPDGVMQFGQAPVVDDGLDAHALHVYRHRKDMHSDLWREVEKAVQWDKVLPLLNGWKPVVAMLMSQPSFPGTPPNLSAGDPGSPPGPPVGIDALQPSPQEYILNLWMSKLEGSPGSPGNPATGEPASPPPPQLWPLTPPLVAVLTFRAHFEEHKLRMAAAQMAAAPAPAPGPAAPPAGGPPQQ